MDELMREYWVQNNVENDNVLSMDENLPDTEGIDKEEMEIRLSENDEYTEDSLKVYLKEIMKYPLLSAEEELEVAKQIQIGGEAGKSAREMLINSNLRLVILHAKRFSCKGVSFLDLVQEGNLGLIKAVEKFDYKKGFRFATYASWWIKQYMGRTAAEQGRMIRIPIYLYDSLYKVRAAQRELTQQLSAEPTVSQIADCLDMEEEKVDIILKNIQDVLSLDTPIGEEQDSSIIELIKDDYTKKPEEIVSDILRREAVETVLSTLSQKEERIIRLRFGMDDNVERTLVEVGKEFGVTRERIRQIEARAIRKMREPQRRKVLQDFN